MSAINDLKRLIQQRTIRTADIPNSVTTKEMKEVPKTVLKYKGLPIANRTTTAAGTFVTVEEFNKLRAIWTNKPEDFPGYIKNPVTDKDRANNKAIETDVKLLNKLYPAVEGQIIFVLSDEDK